MDAEIVSVLKFTLFKHSEESFLYALDEAGINHSRVQIFSSQPQASGMIESINALSEVMPWNSIAKVLVAWIDARKSREIQIQTESGALIHAKGYSINEMQKILPESVSIMVIDTLPESETQQDS